jgi:hypothetical protein
VGKKHEKRGGGMKSMWNFKEKGRGKIQGKLILKE